MAEQAVVINKENGLAEKQIKSNVFPSALSHVLSKKERKASISAYRWLCDFTNS